MDCSGDKGVTIDVHLEVCLSSRSQETIESVKLAFQGFISQSGFDLSRFLGQFLDLSSHPYLDKNVSSAFIEMPFSQDLKVEQPLFQPIIHVFQLEEEGMQEDTLEGFDSTVACRTWGLPSREFHGLWESLVYDTTVQETLLNYCSSAMLFADKGINSHLITWNRLILMYGPPGTGKTSLAKGLAQKLAMRMSDRFPVATMVEINAHSLFSKWFSESGKLVMAMFKKITDMLEDGDCFVCVLIDEVESLSAARSSAMAGNEPSDAIRVVNALLTQLDTIKGYNNALVLTTSNIPTGIDAAFVDRADLKLYVGLPGHKARYNILSTSLQELIRVQIIHSVGFSDFLDFDTVQKLGVSVGDPFQQLEQQSEQIGQTFASMLLFYICQECSNVSGRQLRKLPFTAHAYHVKREKCSLPTFLLALRKAVQTESENRAELVSKK